MVNFPILEDLLDETAVYNYTQDNFCVAIIGVSRLRNSQWGEISQRMPASKKTACLVVSLSSVICRDCRVGEPASLFTSRFNAFLPHLLH